MVEPLKDRTQAEGGMGKRLYPGGDTGTLFPHTCLLSIVKWTHILLWHYQDQVACAKNIRLWGKIKRSFFQGVSCALSWWQKFKQEIDTKKWTHYGRHIGPNGSEASGFGLPEEVRKPWRRRLEEAWSIRSGISRSVLAGVQDVVKPVDSEGGADAALEGNEDHGGLG